MDFNFDFESVVFGRYLIVLLLSGHSLQPETSKPDASFGSLKPVEEPTAPTKVTDVCTCVQLTILSECVKNLTGLLNIFPRFGTSNHSDLLKKPLIHC